MTAVICSALLGSTGCATHGENVGLGISGATAFLAQSPSNELEQIYYLGVFDPQDQLPPAMYRVRVHGQASALNSAKFASGWVRAELIDSLNSGAKFDGTGVSVDQSKTLTDKGLLTGRRLIMFGPEGFREAPKDHRLVIVMGADPSAFFSAMDQSLSIASDAQVANLNKDLAKQLFSALSQIVSETSRLSDLSKNVTAAFFWGSQAK